MFKLISKKIKEKMLKLINKNKDVQLNSDNVVNIQEEQKQLNLGELKELKQCLSFIDKTRENINELSDNQLKQKIVIIDRYINKYRNEYYVKYAEIRQCVRELNGLKSDIQLKMVYGEEKKTLNTVEVNELAECLNFIDNVTVNMRSFDNNQIQKNIKLVDKYISMYNNYYHMNYSIIRKTIRNLNKIKSDMLIKMYYENEFESEEEKVFLKCC